MIGFGGSPGMGWSYLKRDICKSLRASDNFAPVEHVLESREGKCKGLATAGLSNSDNVSATPDDRPALGLDWGGLIKVFHHTHDLCIGAEVSEVFNGFVGLA